MKEEIKMIAPCGLPCHVCILHQAAGDDELANELSRKHGFTPEQMKCDGCRAHDGAPPMTEGKTCETYACVRDRGFEFCYECADFPCGKLAPYAHNASARPHNTKIYNLLLLKRNGFSTKTPTFWVLEGLVYYLERQVVVSLLQTAAKMSTKTSRLFTDICVPVLAELDFGPFTPYFEWGLEKKAVPEFFAATGWKVSCSFADDHDQGRDVGQRGLIFVSGVRD